MLLVTVGLMTALNGCMGERDPLSKAADRTKKLFNNGQMLHLKQVVEHTDGKGQTELQYVETWIAGKTAKSIELDEKGLDLRVAIEEEGSYLEYDPESKKATKDEFSKVQFVDLSEYKASYAKTTLSGEKKYADRDCEVYLLENSDEEDWVQLYVDKETGCVLFCDAPLFRIRTAALEVLEADQTLFSVPADLIYY